MLCAVLYARLLAVPLVMSYHTHIPEYIPRYTWSGLVEPMWSIIRWCTRRADLTLVTSKAMKVGIWGTLSRLEAEGGCFGGERGRDIDRGVLQLVRYHTVPFQLVLLFQPPCCLCRRRCNRMKQESEVDARAVAVPRDRHLICV